MFWLCRPLKKKIAAISYSQILISLGVSLFGFLLGLCFLGFFGCGLILVPYKYSVGGRYGLSQTVLSWPLGEGSQGCVYMRFVRASGCG